MVLTNRRLRLAALLRLPRQLGDPSSQLFQLTGLGLHQPPQSPGFPLQLGYPLPQRLHLVRRAVTVNLGPAGFTRTRVPEVLQRLAHPPGHMP